MTVVASARFAVLEQKEKKVPLVIPACLDLKVNADFPVCLALWAILVMMDFLALLDNLVLQVLLVLMASLVLLVKKVNQLVSHCALDPLVTPVKRVKMDSLVLPVLMDPLEKMDFLELPAYLGFLDQKYVALVI